MIIYEKDLAKIPKYSEYDVAKKVLCKIIRRQFSLEDCGNMTKIHDRPAYECLQDIVANWEKLMWVM
jgi:hypothetical protein